LILMIISFLFSIHDSIDVLGSSLYGKD
jgi:hypothetical protein